MWNLCFNGTLVPHDKVIWLSRAVIICCVIFRRDLGEVSASTKAMLITQMPRSNIIPVFTAHTYANAAMLC